MMPKKRNALSTLVVAFAALLLACGGGYRPAKRSNTPAYGRPITRRKEVEVEEGGQRIEVAPPNPMVVPTLRVLLELALAPRVRCRP
ncbi:MAG: hypothetical protein GY811_25130 [Myxococcales bacterium]|nr:hypothetical protein [Myxococcales bacterium]